MKTWDVIIIGGGIIGLSLSITLRKRGAQVLVVERGEPGREASYAAAGMLAWTEVLPPLRALAEASARMYPEFAHELRDESGIDIDLRDHGTVLFGSPELPPGALYPAPVAELEPAVAGHQASAAYLKEASVDPRALVAAALKTAKHREVDISSGTEVVEVKTSDGRVRGVRSDKTSYWAPVVVNCAGAWAGQLPPHHQFPTRPVRGQMLAVAGVDIKHVLRFPDVYMVPRSDGRVVIGSTLEDVGFDKRVETDAIQRLREAAIREVPAVREARILETWAGLRPGTPDDLPILGTTATEGYFVATGHFRDGILLTPVTAEVMAQIVNGEQPECDIGAFGVERFGR